MIRREDISVLLHWLTTGVSSLLIALASVAHADDPDTFSPVVSFQYQESLADSETTLTSPVVSFQYQEALADSETIITSPVVSFQFYEWPGDENLTFENSPAVSYYFSGEPVIITNPTNKLAQVGTSTSLSVVATGPAPLTYQWRFNGVAISGAKGASLPRPNLQLGDSGSYSVEVRNDSGSILSRDVWLNVYLPPATPQPHPPTLTLATGTPISGIYTAPLATSSTQLKIFNTSGEIDKNKKTIVMTHGWLSGASEADDWPVKMKNALIAKGYDADVNILAWDWSADANAFLTKAASRTLNQGDALGSELLYRLGADYNLPIHFLGHSLGTILNCEAANFIHGDAKNSPANSSLKFNAANTQMTLFDEAELVQPLKAIHVSFAIFLKPLEDTTADLINNLSANVLPKRFKWADNYVSEVGLLQPRAVNVLLWRSKYLPTQLISQHGYSYEWYQETVSHPLDSAMGHRWSFEHGSLDSAPVAPGYYLQNLELTGSPQTVTPLPTSVATVLSRNRLVVYPTLKAYQGLSAIGQAVQGVYLDGIKVAGNVVANVAESFTPINGEPVYVGNANSTPAYFGTPVAPPPAYQATWDFKFTLDKTGVAQSANLKKFSVKKLSLESSAPASPYVIIPMDVPKNALGMSFEYQFEGADSDSYMTMGIDSENYFIMEAKYAEDGAWNGVPVIDISSYAGKTIQIFVGLNGSASTGKVNVRAIQFYVPPDPKLEITPVGNQMKLSWPLTAVDWTLETTTDLTVPDSWQPVLAVPTDLDYEHAVIIDLASNSGFYRLKK